MDTQGSRIQSDGGGSKPEGELVGARGRGRKGAAELRAAGLLWRVLNTQVQRASRFFP